MIASRSWPAALVFLTLGASTAQAADATAEGAARLTEVFRTYLGNTPGLLSVTPAGAAYDLRIDAAPLLALVPTESGSASISPLLLTLTDNGDGTWGVDQDQSITLAIDVPGVFDLNLRVGSYRLTGIFDETLGVMRESTSDFTGMVLDETITPPDRPRQDVSYTVASGHSSSVAKGRADGRVDMVHDTRMSGLRQIMTAPFAEGIPPVEIVMSAKSYDLSGELQGLMPHPLYALLAFAVAHPSEAEVVAAQEELRAALQAALPIFEHGTGTASIDETTIETPIGAFTADSMQVEFEISGLVPEAMVREAITIDGLSIPEGLVPDWAGRLIPSRLVLDVEASGFDLASPAGAAIAAFDLGKPEPIDDSVGRELAARLLPDGVVEITLNPGEAVAGAYTLSYQGRMGVGDENPTGSARIGLTGYDALVEAIKGAPPEIGQQALPLLMMARGMAKTEGETLVWDIDASTPGQLLVNGNDVSVMLGKQ